jgi:DNA-directed RNA polymerase specialized sigma24 family protein
LFPGRLRLLVPLRRAPNSPDRVTIQRFNDISPCDIGPLGHIGLFGKEVSVSESKQNLLQLYRFCFLMLADAGKAEEVFHATLRQAAQSSAAGEPPPDRLWFFRDARWRCVEAGEKGLQAEDMETEEEQISSSAPAQIQKLEPMQLAVWIAAAPEPQRTALALFYLDEFDDGDLLSVSELKPVELGKLLSDGRQQFQAWLNVSIPVAET